MSLNEKYTFKAHKLPEELNVLLDSTKYIGSVLEKNNGIGDTLTETVNQIEKDTCKQLNDQEKEILFSHLINRIW